MDISMNIQFRSLNTWDSLPTFSIQVRYLGHGKVETAVPAVAADLLSAQSVSLVSHSTLPRNKARAHTLNSKLIDKQRHFATSSI